MCMCIRVRIVMLNWHSFHTRNSMCLRHIVYIFLLLTELNSSWTYIYHICGEHTLTHSYKIRQPKNEHWAERNVCVHKSFHIKFSCWASFPCGTNCNVRVEKSEEVKISTTDAMQKKNTQRKRRHRKTLNIVQKLYDGFTLPSKVEFMVKIRPNNFQKRIELWVKSIHINTYIKCNVCVCVGWKEVVISCYELNEC